MRAAANRAMPTSSLTRREMADPFTWSDLHDDWHDERPPAGTLAEEAAKLHSHLLFDDALIRPLLDAGPLDHFDQQPRAFGQQFLAVLHHETAGDDVGDAFERAGLLADGDHRDHQAV